MSDGSGPEITLAQLARKIDEQSRFIRSLILVCVILIVGVQFYTFTELFHSLPPFLILKYMERLPNIVEEWKAIEVNEENKKQAAK